MAGYTRNDTGNNIADGNVINAADLDGEFDSIQTAFNETSGHTHDGTADEGAPISVVGPAQDINVTITEVVPKTTNTMSLGTGALQFKDLYIDGTANIDSLVADTADINAGTIDGTTIGASTPAAITGTSITATGNIAVAGTVDGRDVATDGTKLDTIETNADVTDTANVTAAGALMDSELTNITAVKALDQGVATTDSPSFAGLTATTADINGGTIDGATIATSDITVGAGKTLDVSAGTLTLADDQISGDKIQGGTIGSITITTLTGTTGNITNVNATTVDATNIEVTNIKAKDGTASATIADATGVMTVASSVLTTTDINGGTIDGVTIGGASAGAGTFTSVTGTSLDMNGNADFAGNLNLSRAGGTSLTRTTDTDYIAINSGSGAAFGSNIVLYAGSHASLPNYSIFGGDTMLFRPVDGSPEFMRFVDGTGVVFNENSADVDFRIESDTNANAFFLQGSDGKIGIGTASPLQSLHVNSNGNTQLLISSSFNNSTVTGLVVDTVGDSSVCRISASKSGVGRGTLSFLHSSTAALETWNLNAAGSTVYAAGYSEHIWKTGNTERLRITSTGKVGIGDSAPPTILSVRGDTPESRITNTNTISDTIGTEEVARLGVYGQKNNVYGPAANIVFRQDASTWSFVDQYNKGTRIEFCTQDNTATDTSETPRMVINKDGKVGIGTSSPTEKLHISQDSAFAIQMERTGASPSVCEIQNGGSFLNISQNTTGIVFLTGPTPTEKMRIDASGRAIIPAGVTLGTAAGTYNAANTLDDYEEGTWTPEFTPATGAFGSIGYLFNTGTYTKVGRLVTVTGRIQVSGTPPTIGTAGGNCHLSGFPFIVATGQNFSGAMSFTYFTGWGNSFAPNSAYISPATSLAVLMKRPVPDNNEFLFTPADFISGGANSGFMFTATYFTT
jgi:hypothetical protein